MSFFEFMLLLHVGGAIAGLGPAFGFSVMGPMAGRLGGPQALGIMKAMHKISRGIILPMAIVMGITGAVLIGQGGWDTDFISHEWLWISILLYLVMVGISALVEIPAVGKMIALAEEGSAASPEFGDLAKKTQMAGMALTVMLVLIIILMVLKLGS